MQPAPPDPGFRAFLAATFEHITLDKRRVFLCQALAISKALGLTRTCALLESKL